MTPGKAPPTSMVEVPGGELLISSTSRPEMMKDLDIVGLARLTSVSHGRLIPCLKEGNSVCSHTAQPPGESLCRVLDRRLQPTVEPQVQENSHSILAVE